MGNRISKFISPRINLIRLLEEFSGSEEDFINIKGILGSSVGGVDVNVVLDEDLNRPLHLALKGFTFANTVRYELVRFLIEAGADLNALNKFNVSPFCLICSSCCFDLIK